VEDVDSGTFGTLGDRILINGMWNPFVEVTTAQVRLRLLNASNAWVYGVGFADNRRFHVVTTDRGPLDRPVEADRVKLSPGERAEIVVRFAPGEQIVLNSVGENPKQANDPEEEDFALLRFVAGRQLAGTPPLPATLGGTASVAAPAGTTVRSFSLSGSKINGRAMDPARIDEVVPAGAREIWEVTNTSYAHSFHIHDVTFYVLTVNDAPWPAYLRGPGTPCSSRSWRGYGSPSSSAPPPTRCRRTCTTATSCGTRTRA
jgi:FtsP/CotA-like multicopper oxidase with cupredoxin domain